MQLEYIEDNLNKIIQNPDSVMYIRPYDIGSQRALFAVTKEEQGIYKKVQITKGYSKMVFPFEPIYWFYNGPGYFFLKKFMSFHNNLALNLTHLDGFKHKTLENSKWFNVGIFATFTDGSATFVCRLRKKEFEKAGGIQPYINELKKYKEYTSKHENYQIIECFSTNQDTFIIPDLQENVDEISKVKKLTKN